MAITPLPTPPSRNDPTNFSTRADAFLGALPAFGTEANALQTDVNEKQVTASNAATTATTQAGIATTQAGIATTQAGIATTKAGEAAASALAADASAQAAAALAASFAGTSTTSMSIGIGEKTFTTQSGEQYTSGIWVTIVSQANAANYMFGQVVSYSGSTLVVNVQSTGGSGTHADWNISLAGVRGAPGTGITDQSVGWTASGGTVSKTLTVDESKTTSQLQDLLVSGTNIKTVNGASVLGSGDLEVGGGSLILVDEVNASASSSVELSGMDSTYKSYMIVASNLVMSAGNSISFTIQQGGSYLTTGYYGNRAGRFSGGTNQTNAQIENASNFLFVNNSPEFNNFTMDIFDPAAASQQTQWIVFHTGWTSGTSYQTFSNGAQSSAGATTAIKFAPSGGTITSGNFKLYGLKG